MNPRVLIRGLVLIATLVAVGFVLKTTQLGTALDKEWVDQVIRAEGGSGALLFVAAGALFTAFGLPRQLISFLGGYAFGFVAGTVLAAIATVGGCVSAFFYARLMGRDFIQSRFSARVERIDNFLRDNPFNMALLIRLLPAGSNLLISLTAGVSSVRAAPFFAGSALGFVPQTMVFALAGSGIELDPAFRIGLSVVLFVVSGILGVTVYRKYRRGRILDDTLEAQLGNETPGQRP